MGGGSATVDRSARDTAIFENVGFFQAAQARKNNRARHGQSGSPRAAHELEHGEQRGLLSPAHARTVVVVMIAKKTL